MTFVFFCLKVNKEIEEAEASLKVTKPKQQELYKKVAEIPQAEQTLDQLSKDLKKVKGLINDLANEEKELLAVKVI